jgi:adenine-specific DNA-methyltransferase
MAETKMDGKSATPNELLIGLLKAQCPEVFTEGKIDLDRFKRSLGQEVTADKERYGLNWAGKSDCFRHIQESTTATLVPLKDESVEFDNTENIFIEGDNLQVLKTLQKSYYGKIKMIYIDPPYNTGNDSFIYPDRFQETKEEYLQRIGDKDVEGNLITDGFLRKNTKDSGHFHSNWLSMMYPRLFLARNLLKSDGVIYVSIDDNEVENLKMIMNEIFGEENFISNIIWEKKFAPQNDEKYITAAHDHILLYARNKDQWRPNLLPRSELANDRYSNLDNDPRGSWSSGDLTSKTKAKGHSYVIISPSGVKHKPPKGRQWAPAKDTFDNLIKENRIWFGEEGNNVPRIKQFLSEVQQGIVPMSIWKHTDVGHNQEAKQEFNNIFLGQTVEFDTPKPVRLMCRMMELAGTQNEYILDFFSGSCSLAQAVYLLNHKDGGCRKCICVQLPEPLDETSATYKSGFSYISDIGKERIRRSAKKISDEIKGTLDFGEGKIDLGFKCFRLSESNFKIWRSDIDTVKELETQMGLFVDNVNKGALQENILYELLLKSGFDLNVSVKTKKANGKQYFVLDGGRMTVCLEEKATQGLIDKIIQAKPEKAIFLDKAFEGKDQLKTNTALQMEAENIDFKVI